MTLRHRPADLTAAHAAGPLLVAEPEPLARFGIRRALEDAGFAVRDEVSDSAGAIEAARRERPAVCIVDLDLGGDAIAAIAAISAELPETAIVVLTASRDDPRLFNAMCAGAWGYIRRDIDPAEFPQRLRGVLEGDVALPRSVVSRLVAAFRERASEPAFPAVSEAGSRLTAREREVLDLLRQRLGTAEIARRLFISQVTVRSHVSSIVKKLGVSDRYAAIFDLERFSK